MTEYSHLYNSRRWRRRSSLQLKQHPLCAVCAARGVVTAASIAHHIVPHRGDEQLFWFGSLASTCKPCHDSEIQELEKRGYSTTIGADGYPISALHPFNQNE